MSVEQGESLPATRSPGADSGSLFLLGQAGLLVAFVGLWQLASDRLIDSFFISSPLAVATRLLGWARDGTLWNAFAYTFQATAGGFVIGSLCGFFVGFVLGRSRLLARLLDPFITAIYCMPKIALAPLLIMWFGIGLSSKIALAALIVFFLVFLNTFAGVRDVQSVHLQSVRIMGANGWQELRYVVLPSAAAWVLTGLKVSVPYALIGAVVGRDDFVQPRHRLSHRPGVRALRYRRRVRGPDRPGIHRYYPQCHAQAGRASRPSMENALAMTWDLIIANGLIVDGTGSDAYEGSIAIDQGRIVALGRLDGSARRTIDAAGAVIAPGFVDIHTHYDAQIFWDPFLTISPWHGVTTAVIGSCGFGIAPTRPEGRDLILRTLERVEAMSLDALNAGLGENWPFETFPEYLSAIEARGTAINVGVMVGHTPVRLYVMGEDAAQREATGDEIVRMKSLVLEAMQAGAIAFATSVSNVHIGFAGKPVPSRFASREEMVALASAVGEAGHGIIHYNVAREAKFDDFVAVQAASGATVCWTAVLAGQLGPWRHREVLEKNRVLRRQGLPIYPQVACRPIVSEFDFRSPVIFDTWLLFDPVRKAADLAAQTRHLCGSRVSQRFPGGSRRPGGPRRFLFRWHGRGRDEASQLRADRTLPSSGQAALGRASDRRHRLGDGPTSGGHCARSGARDRPRSAFPDAAGELPGRRSAGDSAGPGRGARTG